MLLAFEVSLSANIMVDGINKGVQVIISWVKRILSSEKEKGL